MPDIASRLADLNIDALLAALEADSAPPASPSPSAASTSIRYSEEQRSARRRDPHALSGDIRLTIPGFSDILMVNISATGALVEMSRPLSLRMIADLFVRLNGKRHALRFTTIRSTLHTITSKSAAVYRTAVQCDRRLPLEAE